MPRFTDVYSNFTGGQIDESVQARTDIDLYRKAFKTLKDCALRITGGVDRRPGTTYGATVVTGAGAVDDWRMLEFVFNDQQKYLVLITDLDILVYTADGTYTACTVTKTASAPWPNGEVKNVRHTHLGDTMILFHKDYQPRRLIRTGATTFSLLLFSFTVDTRTTEKFCPMLPIRQDQNVNISASSHYGTVTVDCLPTGSWLSTDVGKQFYIEGVPFVCASVNTPAAGGFTNMVGNLLEKLDPYYLIGADPAYGPNYGPQNRYKNGETLHEYSLGVGNGIGTTGPNGTQQRPRVQIIDIISSTSYYARGLNESVPTTGGTQFLYGLESELDTRTLSVLSNPAQIRREWFFEEVYNDDNGWPACGVFHEGRLWIAGGDIAPFHVFGSVAGDYFNFKVGDNPDDGIAVACTTNNLSQIIHLHSAQNLQVYTDNGMLYAPSTEEEPLSPLNIRFLSQNKYGAAIIHPETFDGASIFVQENNKTIRENTFSDKNISESQSISLTYQDQLKNITDMAALHGANERDEQYLLVITNPYDSIYGGQLAVFHSIRDENLRGWVPWNIHDTDKGFDNTEHAFVSVATVSNDVYLLAFTQASIIILKLDFDMTMDGTVPLTWVSGDTWQVPVAAVASHLKNGEFPVTMSDSDGNINAFYLGDYTPDGSSQIVIPNSAAYSLRTLYMGIGYNAKIEPLPISKVYIDGDVVAEVKRTAAVSLKIKEARELKVDGQDVNPLVLPAGLSSAPPVVNGIHKFYTMGWEYEDETEITNDQPLYFHLTGIIREVEI